MRYTVEGFNQAKLVEFGLDIIDAMILRWYVDFLPKMTTLELNGKRYCWVKYSAVIEDLPCVGIKNSQVMARRFDNLVSSGVMEKHVERKQGNFTCFRLTNKYLILVEGSTQKSEAPDLKVNTPSTFESTPPDLKVETKDPSIKDPSINDSSITTIKKEKSANASMVVDDVIGYFNEKAGTNKYQSGSDRQSIAKYIQAIIKAGDSIEDIKLVIDYKLANPNTKKIELTAWLNTAYVGNNMADAKTWHARGRPKIDLLVSGSLFAKPERLVPSMSKHDPFDNPDIDSLNI